MTVAIRIYPPPGTAILVQATRCRGSREGLSFKDRRVQILSGGRWNFPGQPARGSAFRKVACGHCPSRVSSSVQGYRPAYFSSRRRAAAASLLRLQKQRGEGRNDSRHSDYVYRIRRDCLGFGELWCSTASIGGARPISSAAYKKNAEIAPGLVGEWCDPPWRSPSRSYRECRTSRPQSDNLGTFPGRAHHSTWLVLPLVVTAFLFQHAIQGWCPPVPILRRLGFRTTYEIEQERRNLLALRSPRGRAAICPSHSSRRKRSADHRTCKAA
jgi:hypothetical protein